MKRINFFIKILILLIIFGIITYSVTFLFSNKLSNVEYDRISTTYKDMRKIVSDIKSDNYIDSWLRCLDREYILNEFKRDAFVYSLTVTTNAADFILNGFSFEYVENYINKCYISFSDYVNVSFAEDLLKVSKEYYHLNSTDENVLQQYQNDVGKIINSANESLSDSFNYNLMNIIIICSFMVILILWQVVETTVLHKKKEKNIDKK